MDFLEKYLEEIIYGADRELLAKKGLRIEGMLKKQLRIGNYGVADLVSINRHCDSFYDYKSDYTFKRLEITIFELKKDKIGISAFLQAIGYLRGIKNYMEKNRHSLEVDYKICLIGSKIDKDSTFIYLADILPELSDCRPFLDLYTYSYDVDGINFKYEYGYKLKDEGFSCGK